MEIKISAESNMDKYPAKAHALRVARALKVKKGLIYLPGTPTRYLEDSDQTRGFRQRRYFYYLSGCSEADVHITYDIEQDLLALWLPPIDPTSVVWNGRGSNVGEAEDKFDIDVANYTTTLPIYFKSWLDKNSADIYVLHPSQKPDLPIEYLASDSPRYNSKDLQHAMDLCRMIKDPHEIGLIRKANDISTKAHTAVLRNLRHFHNEAQVEALFLDVSVAHGAKKQSYSIIAGSGENAAILHYVRNDEDFGNRELMCLDGGAEWNCYASDVTRTFPLSGNWPSVEAHNIYNLVQRMQTASIKALGPGKDFAAATFLSFYLAAEGLLQLGILHNGSVSDILEAGTVFAFFPHGLGHFVGLEVHDVMPEVEGEERTHWFSTEVCEGSHPQLTARL